MQLFKRLLIFENIIKTTLLVFIFVYSLTPLGDPDMFFHIRNGEYLFYNWIPSVDPYSIHSNLTYVQHEWLSDIIFFLIYSISGFTALWMFKIVMNFVIFAALYIVILFVTERNARLSFFAASIATMLLILFIDIRPQVFSFVIIILEILILEKYEATKNIKTIMLLPILSIILINIHGAVVPIFFTVIFGYAASFIFELEFNRNYINLKIRSNTKRQVIELGIVTAISVVFLNINPYGINTPLYLFRAIGHNNMFQYISELKTLDLSTYLGFEVFAVFFLILCNFTFFNNKFTFKQVGFIFMSLIITLNIRRFGSYFIIFASIYFAQYLSAFLTNDFLQKNYMCKKILQERHVVASFIIIIMFMVPLKIGEYKIAYFDSTAYPVKAVEIIKRAENVRLYNEFNWGHYLIFNNIKVFIDGRAEMYTKKFNNVDILDDYLKTVDGSVYPEDTFKKYNLNYFLVYNNRPTSVYLTNNERYELLYADNDYSLLKLKQVD